MNPLYLLFHGSLAGVSVPPSHLSVLASVILPITVPMTFLIWPPTSPIILTVHLMVASPDLTVTGPSLVSLAATILNSLAGAAEAANMLIDASAATSSSSRLSVRNM